MIDFQNWWDGYFHEINGQKETAQAAWQARGERIKELEEKLKDVEDVAWNNYKAVETITDYLIENDWLEVTVEGDGKEAGLNIINSVQKQIASLESKLTVAVEALDSIASDIDTWHSDKAIEALNKIKGVWMMINTNDLYNTINALAKADEIQQLRSKLEEVNDREAYESSLASSRAIKIAELETELHSMNINCQGWIAKSNEQKVQVAELTARIEKDREYALSIKKNLERLWELDK